MGLITKTVRVYPNPYNYKYYENLGYKIPTKVNKQGKIVMDRNTSFEVNVNDLYYGSKTKVTVKCDECGEIFEIPYNVYFQKYNKYNFKIYCNLCVCNLFCSGKNHWNWKDTLTDKDRILKRRYPEYNIFVASVLERDNYTCQRCGVSSKNMEVHHLDGYNWANDKRTDVTNGITLCEDCHCRFHHIYGYKYNTKEQFEEWMNIPDIVLDNYVAKNIEIAKLVYCLEDKRVYNSVLSYCRTHPNTDNSKIYCVCNHAKHRYTAYGKHFLWVNEIITCSNEDINNILHSNPRKDRIISFTNGDRKIVDTYLETYNKYNC